MSQPPKIPDYFNPNQPRPADGGNQRFWTGLMIGIGCSVVFWPIFFAIPHSDLSVFQAATIIFVLVKLVVGLRLAWSDRWHQMGMGLLLSIGIGGLIFFCTCAVAVSVSLRH